MEIVGRTPVIRRLSPAEAFAGRDCVICAMFAGRDCLICAVTVLYVAGLDAHGDRGAHARDPPPVSGRVVRHGGGDR